LRVIAGDTDPEKRVSPEYAAVMACVEALV
jgi:hypothetical protein